jgi:hypothetical protein
VPASKLFEQLQKAAVARAAMSPPPAPPPHSSVHADDMALDMATLKAETDAAVARTNSLFAEEAMVAIRAAAELERAEIERLVVRQAQRLVELEREVREASEVREAAIDASPRFPVARGFGVVAVLLALVLGWYFVPWRSPGADAAKPPPHLKIDPKLDLGRPK